MPPDPKKPGAAGAKAGAAPAGAKPAAGPAPKGGAASKGSVPLGGAIVRAPSAAPVPGRPGGQAAPERAELRRRDPHLGLRFWVQLGQVEIAGFRECSGLEIKTETFDYNEGGLNGYAHRLPVRVGYSNITLKRGMDFGLDLFNWYYAASRGLLKRQNISIVLYSNSVLRGDDGVLVRDIVQRWDLQNAFPCKWNGPPLNAEKGELAIESLEIAHEGLLPTSAPSNRAAATSNPQSAAKSASKTAAPGKKERQFY